MGEGRQGQQDYVRLWDNLGRIGADVVRAAHNGFAGEPGGYPSPDRYAYPQPFSFVCQGSKNINFPAGLCRQGDEYVGSIAAAADG
jgi:hypothetical protein